MSHQTYGAFDQEDFLQEAEIKVITRELEGKVKFESPEQRKKYVNAVARNLRIDYLRSEATHKRIIQNNPTQLADEERTAEIIHAEQTVAKALARLASSSEKNRPSGRLTASVIGSTMAAELIQWELEGLSHRQMACRVFGVASSTPAQTRKISRAMNVASSRFAKAVKELKLCT